jgi:hypothetical protein
MAWLKVPAGTGKQKIVSPEGFPPFSALRVTLRPGSEGLFLLAIRPRLAQPEKLKEGDYHE